jgi:hypothetical protein
MRSIYSLLSIFLSFTVYSYAQTAGTFTFTPITHSPGYSGTRNVLAVWIQTDAGLFVKTKMRNAGSSTRDHLPTWAVNSGGSASNCLLSTCNVTDATTGATMSNFSTHTIVWDGQGVNGAINGSIVTDGIYKITIQETWNHGTTGTTIRSYTFTKGPNAVHLTPADDADFKNMTIDWVPGISNINDIAEKPVIEVYPNPTNGIFTVDYSKASQIKVVNLLGQEVLELDINQNTEGSENIDLSTFPNGMYIVMVYNGTTFSNYKLLLSK